MSRLPSKISVFSWLRSHLCLSPLPVLREVRTWCQKPPFALRWGLYSHERRRHRFALINGKKGSDPKMTPGTDKNLERSPGLATAFRRMDIQGHTGQTAVSFLNTSRDTDRTDFLNRPPQCWWSSGGL